MISPAGLRAWLQSRHVAAFTGRHLDPGETVLAAGFGYIGRMMGAGAKAQQNGVLIVTERRVAFYRKGFFGEIIETLPLKSITSIERRSLLGHRMIRLHVSGDELEFKTFDQAAERALVDAIEAGRRQAG